MKLFRNKGDRNSFIICTVLMATIQMLWQDYGSFDPRDYGFWQAIITSLFTNLFINWSIKYPDPNKKKGDDTGDV